MDPQTEFEEYDRTESWSIIYQKIKNESLNHNYSWLDAKKPEFRSRNRYRDVNPYDHSRVQLRFDDIDYINASLVQAPDAHRSYILTQGPLPSTSGHFWLMVWEQDSRAVLMLNRVIEKGQVKCAQYFPTGSQNEGEDEMVFEDVGLKVTFIKEDNANYFTVRTLQLTDVNTGVQKEVLQFHYTTWPDFGVPQSAAAFIHFLFAVRKSGALEENVGPPVIHCSAGIGRSGTFCLVDTCLVLIEQAGDATSIGVQNVLLEMRKYRMGLIQTADQLRFSYMAIIEGARHVLVHGPCPSLSHLLTDSDRFGVEATKDRNLNEYQDLADSYNNLLDAYTDKPPPLPPRRKVADNPEPDGGDIGTRGHNGLSSENPASRGAHVECNDNQELVGDNPGCSDDQEELQRQEEEETDEIIQELKRRDGVEVRKKKKVPTATLR